MATLADIAKQAEVSTGTVSRVLNNKMTMPIPQATVDRIRRVARQLDYQPHAAARALATGKTHTIGLYYKGTTETMFLRILAAVEEKAQERGYHLLVSSNLESFSIQNAIDGLIYIASLDDLPMQRPPCRKPTVYVSPSSETGSEENLVTWSEFEAAHLAVEHLVSLGHRRIAAIWGDYDKNGPLVPRVAGFRAAVGELGVTGVEMFSEKDSEPIKRGAFQMREILDNHPNVTAVFARNDYLALGALKTLQQAKIDVPEQISLIHYGNSVLSHAVYPELSSVSHPNAEASVIALEKLIDISEGGGKSFPHPPLPITFGRRASCAPPPSP